MIRYALILGALGLSSLAQAATVTAEATSFPAVLKAAQGGDTIQLQGAFDQIKVNKVTFDPPVTLDASAATIKGVTLTNVVGFTLKNPRISGGGPLGYGVYIRFGKYVRVEGGDISNAVRGIVIGDSTDVAAIGNKLHDLRTDGINLAGVQRAVIAANSCWAFSPIVPPDHPDCIQAWNVKDGPIVSDVTIVGNSAEGIMQGVGLYDEPYRNMVVVGNRMRLTYANAVYIRGGIDSVIVGNDVATIAPLKSDGKPSVKTNITIQGAVGGIACGNAIPNVPYNAAAKPCY